MNDEHALPPSSFAHLHWPLALVALAFSFLTFGLPIYSKAIGANALAIGGLYSAFTATLLIGRPVVGWAVDRFGRRNFFVAALIGYAIAMVAFAFASNVTGLVVARLVQGIASSLFWVSLRTIVTDLTAQRGRGHLMGRVQETMARSEIIGVGIGFILVTLFTPTTGWMLAFLIYASGATLSAILAWRSLPETRPTVTTQVDAEPGALITPPLLKLLVAVFITSLAGSMLAPIFLVYLQDKFTTDFWMLGLAFFPGALIFTVLPARMGGLSDRVGRIMMIVVGNLIACVVSLLLPTLPSLFWLIVVNAFAAVGAAMVGPAQAAFIGDLTGRAWRGSGYGVYEFVANLGATIGPLVGGWLYESVSTAAPFYLNGAAVLVSAVWIWWAFRDKDNSNQESPLRS